MALSLENIFLKIIFLFLKQKYNLKITVNISWETFFFDLLQKANVFAFTPFLPAATLCLSSYFIIHIKKNLVVLVARILFKLPASKSYISETWK